MPPLDVPMELANRLRPHLDPLVTVFAFTGPEVRIAGIDVSDLEYELVDFTYNQIMPALQPPTIIDQTTYLNGSDAQDEATWKVSKTITDSYTYGFKEGIKLGNKTAFKVGLPTIIEGKTEVTTELSFEANQSTTITNTRTVERSVKISMPPWKKVTAFLVLTETTYTAECTAKVWVKDARIRLKLAIPITEGIQVPIPLGVPVLGALRLLPESERVFTVEGMFTGTHGTWVYIDKKQEDLPRPAQPEAKTEPLQTTLAKAIEAQIRAAIGQQLKANASGGPTSA